MARLVLQIVLLPVSVNLVLLIALLLLLLLYFDLDQRIRVILVEVSGAVRHFLLFLKKCLLVGIGL